MVIVTLPAYNEEPSLRALLEALRESMREQRLAYRVILVNDGSGDGTAAVADELAARVPLERIDHAENRGLGEAVRSGLLRAVQMADDDDIVVTMDADNTHTPALIASMVQGIRDGSDVVIASRFRPGARSLGVPLYRRLLSRAASWTFRLSFPTRGVRDFTSGYRAYRAGLLARAFERYGAQLFAERGFSCTVDILLKLRALGAHMREVPLVLRYDLKYGVSKMFVMRTIRETLRLLVARRLES
jgi:dolichol-phosphate mannosyltransferase